MAKLNINVREGYTSSSCETSGLVRDQFVRVPKTLNWNNMYAEKTLSCRTYTFGPTSCPDSTVLSVGCLTNVKDSMVTQSKIIQGDKAKCKSSSKNPRSY